MTEADGEPVLRFDERRVSFRKEHFGFLLYDRMTDELFRGNHTGLEVLRRLERGATESDIAGGVAASFAVDEETARADVSGFLRAFENRGWVRVLT